MNLRRRGNPDSQRSDAESDVSDRNNSTRYRRYLRPDVSESRRSVVNNARQERRSRDQERRPPRQIDHTGRSVVRRYRPRIEVVAPSPSSSRRVPVKANVSVSTEEDSELSNSQGQRSTRRNGQRSRRSAPSAQRRRRRRRSSSRSGRDESSNSRRRSLPQRSYAPITTQRSYQGNQLRNTHVPRNFPPRTQYQYQNGSYANAPRPIQRFPGDMPPPRPLPQVYPAMQPVNNYYDEAPLPQPFNRPYAPTRFASPLRQQMAASRTRDPNYSTRRAQLPTPEASVSSSSRRPRRIIAPCPPPTVNPSRAGPSGSTVSRRRRQRSQRIRQNARESVYNTSYNENESTEDNSPPRRYNSNAGSTPLRQQRFDNDDVEMSPVKPLDFGATDDEDNVAPPPQN